MNRFLGIPDVAPAYDPRSSVRGDLRISAISSPVFYGGGDIGLAAAAGIYAASAVASWAQALLMPGVQALANIELMNKQKGDYDKIVAVQRTFLSTAIANYTNRIDSLLPLYKDAFPDVPQAAEYVPVDACCVQGATIECNISHIPRASVYSAAVNRQKEQEAITRAIVFDPRFLVNVDMTSMQISDLLRGVSPVGNVIDVLKDRSEQDALTGNIGNSRKTTARDLGLSKLAMQAAGREEHRRHMASMAGSVMPLSQVSNIEDLMQTPAQRIALALTQAQLIQSSLQNLYNRNAQKDPYLIAELETKIQSVITRLQFEANKATLTNTFVPNYAAILQPMVRSVAAAIGDRVDSPMTNQFYGPPGSQSGFTTQQASQSGGVARISDSGSNVDMSSGRSASDRPSFSQLFGS